MGQSNDNITQAYAAAGLDDSDTPRHLGWLMLTAMGIGATIGAGIFAMPGMIAMKAGSRHSFFFNYRVRDAGPSQDAATLSQDAECLRAVTQTGTKSLLASHPWTGVPSQRLLSGASAGNYNLDCTGGQSCRVN